MSSISKLWRKLQNKAYRDGYTEAQLSIEIPFQIRALRKAHGWTQAQLAERCGIPQARISHIEQPGRDPLSLRTLYRLASAFDVGLLVQFVSFSELVRREAEFNPETFRVASFKKEMDNRFFNHPTLNSPCEGRSKMPIVIFRQYNDALDQVRVNLYMDLQAGCLRQGWGYVGRNGVSMALRDGQGVQIPSDVWEANYIQAQPACWNGANPSPRRYGILTRMLQLEPGDVVIVPKMPADTEFSVARVSEFEPGISYKFDPPTNWQAPCADECDAGHIDFGHIISVDPASVMTFGNEQNQCALTISGQGGYRDAVNIVSDPVIEARLNDALWGLGYL